MARTDEALEILQKADGPLTAKEVFERSNEFQGAAEACWAIHRTQVRAARKATRVAPA